MTSTIIYSLLKEEQNNYATTTFLIEVAKKEEKLINKSDILVAKSSQCISESLALNFISIHQAPPSHQPPPLQLPQPLLKQQHNQPNEDRPERRTAQGDERHEHVEPRPPPPRGGDVARLY